MKQVKTNRIMLLITASVMIIVAMFSLLMGNKSVVRAEIDSKLTSSFSGTANVSVDESNGVIEIAADNDETVIFKNSIALNKLQFKFKAENTNAIEISFKSKSFDANVGEQSITLLVDYANNKYSIASTEKVLSSSEYTTVKFNVEENQLKVSVNGGEEIVYEEKLAGVTNTVAKNFGLKFKTAEQANVLLTEVDQDYMEGSGKYKQTFAVNGGKFTYAAPKISLSDSVYTLTEDGYKNLIEKGREYSLSFEKYSVLDDGVSVSNLYVGDKTPGIYVGKGAANKTFALFNDTEEGRTIHVKSDSGIDETFVFEYAEESELAPKFVIKDSIIKNYVNSIEKLLYSDYASKVYVRLGGNIVLSSMVNMVVDDNTSYEKMSRTVYYKTPYSSSSTSSLELPLDKAGDYIYYVLFTDSDDNCAVTSEEVDEKIENGEYEVNTYSVGIVTAKIVKIEKESGDFYIPVLSFKIEDNAIIEIKGVDQVEGYVGSTYTASAFDLKSSGYTTVYKLYYNEAKNKAADVDLLENEGWVEIAKSSSAKSSDTFPDGFTYNDIKSIAYNGSLTFTPDRIGTYAIKCTVTSSSSVREGSGVVTINVNEKVSVVKPDSHWIQNNLASVIFLSIGVACLIAVAVLLFIKPKEKSSDEE